MNWYSVNVVVLIFRPLYSLTKQSEAQRGSNRQFNIDHSTTKFSKPSNRLCTLNSKRYPKDKCTKRFPFTSFRSANTYIVKGVFANIGTGNDVAPYLPITRAKYLCAPCTKRNLIKTNALPAIRSTLSWNSNLLLGSNYYRSGISHTELNYAVVPSTI